MLLSVKFPDIHHKEHVRNPAPLSILTHPKALAVTENDQAVYIVKVTGTAPFSYQWQLRADEGASWTNLEETAARAGAIHSVRAVGLPAAKATTTISIYVLEFFRINEKKKIFQIVLGIPSFVCTQKTEF